MKSSDVLSNLLESYSNNTIEDIRQFQFHRTRPLPVDIVASFLIFLCAVAGIVGNGAVIVVSFTSETLKNQTGNLLVAYLSSIDLLTSVLIAIPEGFAVALDRWPFGDTACLMHASFATLFYPASSLTLSLIAMDRLVALSFPLRYTTWVTKNVVYAVCAANTLVWLSLGYIGVRNKSHLARYMNEELVCLIDYASGDSSVLIDFVLFIIVGYFIPAVIITVCYTIIVILVRRPRHAVLSISRGMNDNDLHVIIQTERSVQKAIRSLIIVAVNFFVMYLTCVGTLSFKHVLGFKSKLFPWISLVANLLIFYTCAVNPFFYGIFRKDYRDAFKKILEKVLRAF